MSDFVFTWDKTKHPLVHVPDARYDVLGEWVLADLGMYFGVVLDALAMADDVANGHEPFEVWDSENYEVSYSPDIFRVRNVWFSAPSSEYPADLARSVIEDYWRFIVTKPDDPATVREYRPDLPEWQADLLWWENQWGRPHPYRGRLLPSG